MDFRVKRAKLQVLSDPEEGLRTLVERAPQAEAWAEQILEKFRPTLAMLHSVRRRVATGAVAVLTMWLFLHVMFGANGMVVYRQKKVEYQSLQNDIGSLAKENQQYTQRINSLQTDPKVIEKEAREQLHYTRPGEVVYVSPPPPAPPPPPERNSARK
jgi:cell division protein FtsB